jgi:prepilin-type N-terminal cleavage/methylation domain-containing protein
VTRRSQSGLTLVEVLVAMALLAVLLVPAMRSLQTGIVGADVHSDIAANHFRLTSRLEQLMAEPFVDLSDAAIAAGAPTTATSFSDAAGPPGRLLVYLSLYDGDNADADSDPFTGTDADLLWVRVDIEDTVHTLETIRASGH